MNATSQIACEFQCRKFTGPLEKATFRDRVIAEDFKHDVQKIHG